MNELLITENQPVEILYSGFDEALNRVAQRSILINLDATGNKILAVVTYSV